MRKSEIVKFAEDHGYSDAEYIGKWKNFKYYEPILSEKEVSFIGLPLLILIDQDENMRMSTPEEAMEQLNSVS